MSQTKMTINFFKFISSVFLCCQGVSALDVSLDVIGRMIDGQTLICGTNVTFVCSVIPATNTMDYLIDNTIVGTCKFGLCAAQPSKPSNALFEFSTIEGIYNLTFIPVTENDGGKEYKCQFGSDIKFITPSVTVFPDESFSVITNSSDSSDINVTVSTCVSKSDNVSFAWYIFKAGEDRKSYDTSPTARKNVSACQSTTNCNGEMLTSTITFNNEKDNSAELFFFQVDIIYTYSSASEPYILTIDSPTPYRISVKVSGGNGGFNYLWLLLLLLLLIPCGIGICCCCCKGKQNASNTKRGFQMTTSLQTEIPKFAPVNPFATHCNIEWTGSASEYMLEYRLENEKDWNKQGIILKERKTCLRNLQPDKSYKIRVYAINQSNVVLEPPGESQFKTKGKEDTTNSSSKEENKETASPLPNLNVTIKSANTEPSSTCYDIKWDVENVDETRRVVLRYMLEYSLGDEDNWTKEKHILFDNNFKFENLSPETSYKIRVYPIYQSKVLTPGEYQFRTQPRKNHS